MSQLTLLRPKGLHILSFLFYKKLKSFLSQSCIYTHKKTADTCCCHWKWRFEKIGIFLLKSHWLAEMTDPQRLCKWPFRGSTSVFLLYAIAQHFFIGNFDNFYFTFEFEIQMWVRIYQIFERDQIPIHHLSNKSNLNTDKPKVFFY